MDVVLYRRVRHSAWHHSVTVSHPQDKLKSSMNVIFTFTCLERSLLTFYFVLHAISMSIVRRDNLTWIEDMIVFSRHHLSCLPDFRFNYKAFNDTSRQGKWCTYTLEGVQQLFLLIVGQFQGLSIPSHHVLSLCVLRWYQGLMSVLLLFKTMNNSGFDSLVVPWMLIESNRKKECVPDQVNDDH